MNKITKKDKKQKNSFHFNFLIFTVLLIASNLIGNGKKVIFNSNKCFDQRCLKTIFFQLFLKCQLHTISFVNVDAITVFL